MGIAELAHEYWEGTLEANPRMATEIGEHRWDDRIEDVSPEARAAERRRLEAVLARARGEGDLTLEALRAQVRSDLDLLAVPQEEWTVDPLEGPQVDLLEMVQYHEAHGPEQARTMLARWRAAGRYMDQCIANLRRGLAAGKVGTRDAARKVLAQLDETLALPLAEWPLVARPLATSRGWSPAEEARFRADLEAVVRDVVRPAFERFRALVRDEVLPRARGPERPGLLHVDAGAYARLIRVHTSLALPAEEIHRIGLECVRRVGEEIAELGGRLFGTRDVRKKLASDPAMFFATREEVYAKAEHTLRRAEAAMPAFFNRRPRTPCVVKAMEPHEEKYSTIAFYRPPAADGSRPGTYMINTYLPETRPRYEAQALAFHEAVPGHHTQIALAQELEGLPEFRKHAGMTAYVEGWALYTERLADEMGLYDGDLDRLGMLSFDAWRACRLVVDTGIHALGWSRQQAIDYMSANTLLASNNIENEVDRYIVWPGQALAYKLGQLEIQRLRDEARRALGARFSIRDFHDRVLETGPITLELLRKRIEAWVARPAEAP